MLKNKKNEEELKKERTFKDSPVNKEITLSNKRTRLHAKLSLYTGIPLAFLYMYLFMWKPVGISYLIFVIALIFVSALPALLQTRKLPKKFNSNFIIYSIALLLPSLTFIYLNDGLAKFWAFVLAPFIYSILILNAYNPETTKNFGALYLLKIPFLVVGQFFAKSSEFLRNHLPKLSKSPKISSILRRALLGIFIAVPFLFVFYILFSSSDPEFSKSFSDFLNKIVGVFFDDGTSFGVFIWKFILGYFVGLHIVVYQFYSWIEDSSVVNKFAQLKDFDAFVYKKNWDYVVLTAFLFMLNLLFLSYIMIQGQYLFSGEANVIGKSAEFTYAIYARRGFAELIIVSGLVYIILLVVNLKTELVTIANKIIFRINSNLFGIFTLIIAASALNRIIILQSIYGYTDVRLNGLVGTVFVSMLIIGIMTFSWLSNYVKRASQMAAITILLLISFYLFFPVDSYLARNNYNRFEKTGLIDLPYLINLSDDAIPVLIEVAKDHSVPSIGRNIVMRNLSDRYESFKYLDGDWMSYSPVRSANYEKVRKLLKHKDFNVEQELDEFVRDYFKSLKEGDLDEVYDTFWSASTNKLELFELYHISIVNVDVNHLPKFNNWSAVNYRKPVNDFISSDVMVSSKSNYWEGMTIYAQITYTVGDSLIENCINEKLNLKLEDGEWKVVRADAFVLGNFNDNGETSYYYEKEDNSHLFDENYCYEEHGYY